MISTKESGRRRFLKDAVAAGTALGFPYVLPASALGLDGTVAPSNRIVMAAIGVGGMGKGNMRSFLGIPEVQYVAVCDVDQRHLTEAKELVDKKYGNTDCATYGDFRELLARGDLDAVNLALPDHWHAVPAIAAARAGLDIYGEKPLARSIREGRAICDAVARHGRVWQMGSWQRSQANFHRAAELVRNGRIGTVKQVEVGLPTGSATDDYPVTRVPEGLDWDMWLGPAPAEPYRPFSDPNDNRRGMCHWSWRWILDYSGGQLTDWAGHHIDIAHWGLGLDETGPVEIEGAGVYPETGRWNVPMEYRFVAKYANGVEISVANNKQIPMGTKWIGDLGWIYVSRGVLEYSDPDLAQEHICPGETRLYLSRNHHQNFIDCVKTRQPTITPAETGHRSISVGLLGEIAMLTGRRIKWNPNKEEILGDEAASRLLGRSYRAPWTL